MYPPELMIVLFAEPPEETYMYPPEFTVVSVAISPDSMRNHSLTIIPL